MRCWPFKEKDGIKEIVQKFLLKNFRYKNHPKNLYFIFWYIFSSFDLNCLYLFDDIEVRKKQRLLGIRHDASPFHTLHP
jgi:hypothetical protein